MTTLVTGASGFVGAAVVRQLLDRGENIRVLTRSSSDQRNLQGLDVEIVTGDLSDPASLKTAVSNCNYLYHVAADYRLWAKHPQELYKNNVDGTENLMLAALDSGLERIVYTSSVAVLGINADATPSNEDTPVNLEMMIGDYKRSKYLAEECVKKLIRERDLPAVIVNPSTPIGPRDIKPTPTGRIIVDAVAGRMPAYVDTGLNVAHVDDVAAGHLLAFDKGVIGERYILGGEDLSLREILIRIAAISDGKPPLVRLPASVVLPIAWISEFWANLTDGEEPRATIAGVRMSRKKMFFSCAKAERELDYKHRPAQQALTDAINWFQENNYC